MNEGGNEGTREESFTSIAYMLHTIHWWTWPSMNGGALLSMD